MMMEKKETFEEFSTISIKVFFFYINTREMNDVKNYFFFTSINLF